MKNLLVLTLIVALPALAVGAPVGDATDWAQVAQRDLDALHQTILAGHPGVVDELNPGFRDWVERGYLEAGALSKKVTKQSETLAPLVYYTTGFMDGHLGAVRVGQDDLADNRWAGWLAAKRGDDYVVSYNASGWQGALPPVGATLLRCDGRAITEILTRDIAPFFDRRTYLELTKARLAGFLTLEVGWNPWRAPLAQCDVRLASGEQQTYALAYRAIDAPASVFYHFKNTPRQGIVDLGGGRYWIHVSTFQPDQDQLQTFQGMLARLPALREAKLIVFDTRGNQGGNSLLGNQLFEALYGAAFVAQRRDALTQPHPYAQFRASAISQQYLDTFVLPLIERQAGRQSEAYAEFGSTSAAIAGAIAAGQHWVRQGAAEGKSAVAVPGATATLANPVSARVAFITRSDCASACLDFADVAKLMPDVVFLGQGTSADTVYLEAYSHMLPSGLTRMVMPVKVWRNRQRGNNQPYLPDFHFDGDIDDTNALRAWTLRVLNIDGA